LRRPTGGIPASQEIVDLIAGSSANIPNMAGLSTVDVDDTMGDYIDED
jgi:hypothetical protein